MTVVAFRLAGPLQSWGASSRFVRRGTEQEPTKSGVLGLVAAAQGLRRSDPLESLLGLRFGVRIDQPGTLVRDFQTARQPVRQKSGQTKWSALPLSQRYYIADAVYLAVLEGDRDLVTGIDEAVRSPKFPLYLGRRSCPPAGPVALGLFEEDLETVLATVPWLANRMHQRQRRSAVVRLATARDAASVDEEAELIRDVPLSFDPNHRQYGWRRVVRGWVEVENRHWIGDPEHEPMAVLEG